MEQELERLVAEIPALLKRRAAARAAMEGRTIREIIIELLERWLDDNDTDSETQETATEFALA